MRGSAGLRAPAAVRRPRFPRLNRPDQPQLALRVSSGCPSIPLQTGGVARHAACGATRGAHATRGAQSVARSAACSLGEGQGCLRSLGPLGVAWRGGRATAQVGWERGEEAVEQVPAARALWFQGGSRGQWHRAHPARVHGPPTCRRPGRRRAPAPPPTTHAAPHRPPTSQPAAMAGPNGGEAPRELPADGGVSDAVRAAMAGLAEGGASDGDVEGNVIVRRVGWMAGGRAWGRAAAPDRAVPGRSTDLHLPAPPRPPASRSPPPWTLFAGNTARTGRGRRCGRTGRGDS